MLVPVTLEGIRGRVLNILHPVLIVLQSPVRYVMRKLTQAGKEHRPIKCEGQDSERGLVNSKVWLIVADQPTLYLCSAKNFKLGGWHSQHSLKKAANQILWSLCTSNASLSLCLCSISSFCGESPFLLICMRSNPTYSRWWSDVTLSIKLLLIHFDREIISLLQITKAYSTTLTDLILLELALWLYVYMPFSPPHSCYKLLNVGIYV